MTETHPAMLKATRHPLLEWWSSHIVQSVDHEQVVDQVQQESRWSGHYLFMTLMSAGIAVLGLLLSSPAVVIGAMLISPLMGPIIGVGFALATFDSVELRRTALSLLLGTIVAILFCALVVLASPLQTVTEEITARTKPNLFDLLVALFSGLAGTYAMIRGRHGTIVGVAIATALMPPLAVIGYGLATSEWAIFRGASLLFFTNLMTIAVAAAILARIYGFASDLSPRQTGLQATLVIVTFVALGVPLGLSLRQIAWETLAARQAREVVVAAFGDDSRLSEIKLDYSVRPIGIHATVLTPRHLATAERDASAMLERLLDAPVSVTIDQFLVATEEGAAAAALNASRNEATERSRSRLAERLALVAGTDPGQVLIDSQSRVATVRAGPLAGADLETYRALEQRVAGMEPRWRIVLVPPALPLPDIVFEAEEPDAEELGLATWAGRRLSLPVDISGGSEAEAQATAEAFQAAGIEGRVSEERGGPVRLSWAAPDGGG